MSSSQEQKQEKKRNEKKRGKSTGWKETLDITHAKHGTLWTSTWGAHHHHGAASSRDMATGALQCYACYGQKAQCCQVHAKVPKPCYTSYDLGQKPWFNGRFSHQFGSFVGNNAYS
jgi:hypothetical protein